MPRTFRFRPVLWGAFTALTSGCSDEVAPVNPLNPAIGGQANAGSGSVEAAGMTSAGAWSAGPTTGGVASIAGAGGVPDTLLAGPAGSAGAVVGGSAGAGGTASLIPDPTVGGWQLNEYSTIVDGALELTPGREDTDGHERGTAFWPTAIASEGLHIEFDADIAPKQGPGDGMTLVLADVAAGAKPSDFGDSGGGLGYSSAPCCMGIKGLAVALDTSKNANDPSANFIGVATGGLIDKIAWVATKAEGVPIFIGAVHHLAVSVAGGALSIAVDGTELLHTAPGTPSIPAQVLVGFTGANGSGKSRQLVRNVVVSRKPFWLRVQEQER